MSPSTAAMFSGFALRSPYTTPKPQVINLHVNSEPRTNSSQIQSRTFPNTTRLGYQALSTRFAQPMLQRGRSAQCPSTTRAQFFAIDLSVGLPGRTPTQLASRVKTTLSSSLFLQDSFVDTQDGTNDRTGYHGRRASIRSQLLAVLDCLNRL